MRAVYPPLLPHQAEIRRDRDAFGHQLHRVGGEAADRAHRTRKPLTLTRMESLLVREVRQRISQEGEGRTADRVGGNGTRVEEMRTVPEHPDTSTSPTTLHARRRGNEPEDARLDDMHDGDEVATMHADRPSRKTQQGEATSSVRILAPMARHARG